MKIIFINITKQIKSEELAFLDVQVRGNKNIFLTLVYRNKTFTGC